MERCCSTIGPIVQVHYSSDPWRTDRVDEAIIQPLCPWNSAIQVQRILIDESFDPWACRTTNILPAGIQLCYVTGDPFTPCRSDDNWTGNAVTFHRLILF